MSNPSPNRPGRPTKLTPEITARVIEAVRNGCNLAAACRVGGISYRCLRNWVLAGEEAESGEYIQFLQRLRQAQAELEAELVGHWRAQTATSWQAARDLLARRFPKRWAPRRRHEVTGAGGEPLVIISAASRVRPEDI